jgi:hypothetical protein
VQELLGQKTGQEAVQAQRGQRGGQGTQRGGLGLERGDGG